LSADAGGSKQDNCWAECEVPPCPLYRAIGGWADSSPTTRNRPWSSKAVFCLVEVGVSSSERGAELTRWDRHFHQPEFIRTLERRALQRYAALRGYGCTVSSELAERLGERMW